MTDLKEQKEILRLKLNDALKYFIEETDINISSITITPNYLISEFGVNKKLLNCGKCEIIFEL